MAKTFLVVDDSASMRQLITFAMQDAGYEVLLAENGNDALGKLGGAKIDMVITDLNMPDMDGIELIAQLRGMPAYKFVPIVMLTTEAQDEKKMQGKAAGASGWLVAERCRAPWAGFCAALCAATMSTWRNLESAGIGIHASAAGYSNPGGATPMIRTALPEYGITSERPTVEGSPPKSRRHAP